MTDKEDLTLVSCIIESIKQVKEKRSNAWLAEHFITFSQVKKNSIMHEYECQILLII